MIPNVRFFITIIIMLAAASYMNLHQDVPVPPRKPLEDFPLTRDAWRMVSQSTFTEGVLAALRPTDYLSRTYSSSDAKVGLYVGYHSGGKDSGGIHSPKHCLPGSGWYEISSVPRSLSVPGGKINLVEAIYQKGEQKELFLYWFQVRDDSLSNEYSLKIAEITNSFLHKRRDSAFIRVSVPFEDDHVRAVATAERFIRDFHPAILSFLPL